MTVSMTVSMTVVMTAAFGGKRLFKMSPYTAAV